MRLGALPTGLILAAAGRNVGVALAFVALGDPERRAVVFRHVQSEVAHHSSLDESVRHLCLGEAQYQAAVDLSFGMMRLHPLGSGDFEAWTEGLVLFLQGGDVRCFGGIDRVEPHAMHGNLKELFCGRAGLAEARRPALFLEEGFLFGLVDEEDAHITAGQFPGGDDGFRLRAGLLDLVNDGFVR